MCYNFDEKKLKKGGKMNSILVRQSRAIEDLMYSSKNYVTVEEALPQFDYIFKQLLLVHQVYHSLQGFPIGVD